MTQHICFELNLMNSCLNLPWTINIDARLAAHNAGVGARATRGRKWKLLYAESYQSKSEAMSREWHLKRNRKLRRDIASVMTPGE